MLALARRRADDLPVELVQADVLAWRPPRRFDTLFFAFWLTHVPLPVRRLLVDGRDGPGPGRSGLRPDWPSWAGRQWSRSAAGAGDGNRTRVTSLEGASGPVDLA